LEGRQCNHEMMGVRVPPVFTRLRRDSDAAHELGPDS
jgi:hypothetical protein